MFLQPGTTAKLDTLGDRLMYRLAHFNERGTQHFVITHSVNNTTGVAARWYEFRVQCLGTTNLSLHQSFPSIYFAGQTAGDPLGTTDTEALIKQGTGFQPDTDNRSGDYSSMALDGADSCTFWYASEYYDTDLRFNWATWVASLKFPNCR